jgi:hypothetical protein
MSDVRIILAHPFGAHRVGEIITVDENEGRSLVQAAAGRYVLDAPVEESAPPEEADGVPLDTTGDGTGEALPPIGDPAVERSAGRRPPR